jgi:chorismate dehydratase
MGTATVFVRMCGPDMRKLRVSAISFLNTAPLMWDFEHGCPPSADEPGPRAHQSTAATKQGNQSAGYSLRTDFEVSYTIPSQCAEALHAGTADIGIIPVAAYASISDLVIVPDVAIAARGPVRSILLVSKVPLEQIRTLAADNSSRTSVALGRVLFHRWFKRVPSFEPAEPKLESMLACCDSALLIGDPALRVDRSRYLTWDLADEWIQLTGKPFVFAFWAMRLAALREARPGLDVSTVFQKSRDHGLRPDSIAAIAQAWSPRVGLSPTAVCEYLTQNVHYWLDQQCIAGMDLFFRYAVECGAIPSTPPRRFLGTLRSALAEL